MNDATNRHDSEEGSPNIDPLSGQKGAHPVGVGMGAASAGAAGAAIGSVVGPVGTVVGAVVGAVAGGLAGKSVAESIDPTIEGEYWKSNYSSRPYADKSTSYDDIAPAYQYGWESRAQHADRSFDDAEQDLARGWQNTKHATRLGWEKAKHATRDAWDRIDSKVSGSFRHS